MGRSRSSARTSTRTSNTNINNTTTTNTTNTNNAGDLSINQDFSGLLGKPTLNFGSMREDRSSRNTSSTTNESIIKGSTDARNDNRTSNETSASSSSSAKAEGANLSIPSPSSLFGGGGSAGGNDDEEAAFEKTLREGMGAAFSQKLGSIPQQGVQMYDGGVQKTASTARTGGKGGGFLRSLGVTSENTVVYLALAALGATIMVLLLGRKK